MFGESVAAVCMYSVISEVEEEKGGGGRKLLLCFLDKNDAVVEGGKERGELKLGFAEEDEEENEGDVAK
jgi:hypothetical protein